MRRVCLVMAAWLFAGAATFGQDPYGDISDVKLAKINDTVQIAAKAFYADGTELKDPSFLWYSSNEHVLTVDAKGKVTGVGHGTAYVWVIVDGQPDSQAEGQVHVVVENELPDGHGLSLAEISGGRHDPTFRRLPMAAGNPRNVELQALHARVYDPNDGKLVRADIPFWLIRFVSELTSAR